MGFIGNVKIGNDTHLVGSTLYGTCSTAAGTAAKQVTCANFDQLLNGVTVHIKFVNSNTAVNPTLNINNTGAKTIYRYGTAKPGVTENDSWRAGAVISFTFDGTNWIMNDNIEGGGAKTFEGTTQEWENLSLADKKSYDNVILTDDYDDPGTVKASIADDFSTSVNYAVGDFCYHLGTLYKCTTAHTAGAWNAEHFTATQVGDEIGELKNTLGELGDTSSYSGTGYSINKVGKVCILTINGATDPFNVPEAYIPNDVYRGDVEDANGEFVSRVAITAVGLVNFIPVSSTPKYGSIVYFV